MGIIVARDAEVAAFLASRLGLIALVRAYISYLLLYMKSCEEELDR